MEEEVVPLYSWIAVWRLRPLFLVCWAVMANGYILVMLKSLFHSIVLTIKIKVVAVPLWMTFISFSSTSAGTQELVSWMRGHDSSVSSISVHGSGKYAITTSTDTAQLWDLDTFQRIRKLNVRQSVGIQKVSKEQLLKGEQAHHRRYNITY